MSALTLHKSENLDDWYTIELAEHDGRQWLEKTSHNVMSLRCSSRISDADVEGSAAEMLAIAAAITLRDSIEFRRCAVWVDGDRVFFSSPRNSTREGECSLQEADDLARAIRATLG